MTVTLLMASKLSRPTICFNNFPGQKNHGEEATESRYSFAFPTHFPKVP